MENGLLKIFFDNIEELRRTAIRLAIPIIVSFCIFLMFDLRLYTFYGYTFWFLYPDPYRNIGAQMLSAIILHVVGTKFKLLALRPTDGVVADFYACMFLSVIFTSPNIFYQISRFVGPALKANERELFRIITIPALILFIVGSSIGIIYVAPLMFDILYNFDVGIGVQPTMGISSFVSFFLIYVLSFGASFETPVIMVGLTYMGIVKSETWKAGWRYAVVGALIFGVIFSPGVIGFTMMLLAIPIIVLYFAGIYISVRIEKKRVNAQPIPGKVDS